MAKPRYNLRKIRTIFLTLIISLMSAVVLYLAAAVLLSLLPVRPPEQTCPPDQEIFLTTNGIHLDIILPVNDIGKELSDDLELPSSTRYVSFGWGDKEFYIKTPYWDDLTFPVAFRALFLKSESAMHVTRYSRAFPSWKPLDLCRHQLEAMNHYIENSFQKTENGDLIKLSFPGYSSDDMFYEARGCFSLFRTCNVWTNKAMKRAEVKTSVWSPFDFGVLYHLSN